MAMSGAKRVVARPEPAVRAEELEELWLQFRTHHDLEARNALATVYYPLVRNIARMMMRSLAGHGGLDDLESFGAEGLLAAIERFDPDRGYEFAAFAGYRIRYAILDGVRSADWVPRSVREHERRLRRVEEDSLGRLARLPSAAEEADELGVSLDELHRVKSLTFRSVVTSITPNPDREDLSGPTIVSLQADPGEAVVASEVIDLIREGMDSLPERQRTVLALSLETGATLAEIGRILGVTESRVCQIRATGMARLRSYLTERGVGAA
jgi:RNA polymerase sigma factor FliA